MSLDGLTVLDISGLLPGGYCTQVLQQQGARVIKIEPPAGDSMRRLPGGEVLFAALHQGKRLLRMDLRSPTGRADFLEQAGHADVVVEGFRPGVMERLQLGYELLAGSNPRLIYCAITGYGSHGKLAARAGHDLNYLARSGVLSLMPSAGGLPVIPGVQIADLAGGLQAAFMIAAALATRSTTGQGCRLEVSMTALMRTWTTLARAAQASGLPDLGLSGRFPCYQVYAVSDGWITVAALESKFWQALCRAIERDDLIPRQFDPTAIGELAAVFKPESRAEWMARFAARDVCVEPVLSLAESGDLTDF